MALYLVFLAVMFPVEPGQPETVTPSKILVSESFEVAHIESGIYIKDTNAVPPICSFRVNSSSYGSIALMPVPCDSLKYYFGDK